MSMDHLFTWRPREDRETTILRCNQGESVALVVHELRSRKVPGAAMLYWMHNGSPVANNGFRNDHLLNRRAPFWTSYRHTKSEQLILIINYGCAVNCCETCNSVHCLFPEVLIRLIQLLLDQICEG